MIYCELERAITRCIDEKSDQRWELIGIEEGNLEIHIATFSEKSHAYQALRQLFEIITRGDQNGMLYNSKHTLSLQKLLKLVPLIFLSSEC